MSTLIFFHLLLPSSLFKLCRRNIQQKFTSFSFAFSFEHDEFINHHTSLMLQEICCSISVTHANTSMHSLIAVVVVVLLSEFICSHLQNTNPHFRSGQTALRVKFDVEGAV